MKNTKLSQLARGLGSLSISSLSEKIKEKSRDLSGIFNLTIGDFSPKYFKIPSELKTAITLAYRQNKTNYPMIAGVPELRVTIAKHFKLHGKFDYQPEEIIVASGTRPLIYLLFKVLVNPGEKVIYTVPSWNNQNFIYLAGATPVIVAAKPENNFLITAAALKPHLKHAALITLNSPLNPSGTILDPQTLKEIWQLVVAENNRRIRKKLKPLYVFFDIVYWLLTYSETKYANPLSLNKKIRDYVVLVDGISKCFAATGVRVGWACGPQPIISKMCSMLAHIGACAPKPEQIGVAKYLQKQREITTFLHKFKQEIAIRLNIFYTAIQELKTEGYKVDAIEPQGAIYLPIKLNLRGAHTKNQQQLKTVDDILWYLLEDAKVALVPFYFFGTPKNLPWFRLSVGTCSINDAIQAAKNLQRSIRSLVYKKHQ